MKSTDAYKQVLHDAKSLALNENLFKDTLFKSTSELHSIRESIFRACAVNFYSLGVEALNTYAIKDKIYLSTIQEKSLIIGSVIMDSSPRFTLDLLQLHHHLDQNVSISRTGLLQFLQKPTIPQSYLYRSPQVNPRAYVQWPMVHNKSKGDHLNHHTAVFKMSNSLSDAEMKTYLDSLQHLFNLYAEQSKKRNAKWKWYSSRNSFQQKKSIINWLQTCIQPGYKLISSPCQISMYFFEPAELSRQETLFTGLSSDHKNALQNELMFQQLQDMFGMANNQSLPVDDLELSLL